jgi:hypothetical protein
MPPPSLHIVAFDIPWPANYGGVIDVFHKLRVLHGCGTEIILHCFQDKREKAPELEAYCRTVYYYPRRTGLLPNISLKPYIVASRLSEDLLQNLLKDTLPILFEGLHTCGIMADPRLKGRRLIYRESNIEHRYYFHLAKAENNIFKKLFFIAESLRLKRFQRVLAHASVMLAVSEEDTAYLATAFPTGNVLHLPSFHPHEVCRSQTGHGGFVLYHGKLSVPENSAAARFLIREVWNDQMPQLVIAGLDPPPWLVKLAAQQPNIRFSVNPGDDEMQQMIREAHINLMVTFQATGLKLKLLNALFNGRYCVVNAPMTSGTSLGALCITANSAADIRSEIVRLIGLDFPEEERIRREMILQRDYANLKNCRLLQQIISGM